MAVQNSPANPVEPKCISLALQGGGSHGALAWGVIDRLLEDERLNIIEVSGTSAGAMNAVVLADGLERGGREGARRHLRRYWKAVSDAARFSPMRRTPWDKFWGRYTMDHSPGYLMMESLSRMFSPYELNPMDYNPLRNLLLAEVDFDNVNNTRKIKVCVTATNVRTGLAHVFYQGQLSCDAVLASACLPQMYKAVEIDGEAYWDGGFSANPALFPLVKSPDSKDVLIVQINPIRREELPRTARDIINRMNEISFNTSLVKELRALAEAKKMQREGHLSRDAAPETFIHMIHVEADVQDLAASSKLNAEWSYLELLFARGRRWADLWLAEHFDDIGQCSTFKLEELFEKLTLPEGLDPLYGK